MSERGRIIFAMNCSSVTLLFDREIIPGRIARGRGFLFDPMARLGRRKSVLDDNRPLFVRKRKRRTKRKEEETAIRRSRYDGLINRLVKVGL